MMLPLVLGSPGEPREGPIRRHAMQGLNRKGCRAPAAWLAVEDRHLPMEMRHRAAKGREAQRQRLEEVRHKWLRFRFSARGFNARSDCLRLAARNSRIEAAVRRVGGTGWNERCG